MARDLEFAERAMIGLFGPEIARKEDSRNLLHGRIVSARYVFCHGQQPCTRRRCSRPAEAPEAPPWRLRHLGRPVTGHRYEPRPFRSVGNTPTGAAFGFMMRAASLFSMERYAKKQGVAMPAFSEYCESCVEFGA